MLLRFGQGRIGVEFLVVALVVVEDRLEQPALVGQLGRVGRAPARVAIRRPVTVPDALQVAVGRARAVALVGLREIDVLVVLRRVLVDDGVALVVVALADKPAEDPSLIAGIEDARAGRFAVPRRDVVLGDRAPIDIGGGGAVFPALHAG